MDNLQNKVESKTLYQIKPSTSIYNKIQSNKITLSQNQENKIKNINLKFSISNKNSDLIQNHKIKIIPGIIEKKDLLLNNNKTLLDIKDMISNKIRTLRCLVKEKKDEKIKINQSENLLFREESKEMFMTNFRITNQQILIKGINNNDNNDEENFVQYKNEGNENSMLNQNYNEDNNYNENKEIENVNKIVIRNKFLGSPKLRNTTPLIDNELELRFQLKSGNKNKIKNNISHSCYGDFKNRTSDHFFMSKQNNKKLINRLNEDSEIVYPNNNDFIGNSTNINFHKRQRSYSNRFYNREFKNSLNSNNNMKNKSTDVVSEFNIKNFNPESQIYFNKQFFEQIDNYYPINLKKDYYIEPSKKLKADKNKVVTIGNFGFFPNRKNNNSILHKMKNSEIMEINRNLFYSARNENNNNNINFNFMNPQVLDFYDFERELNNKKLNSNEKHACCMNKNDLSGKKEKLDSFRNSIKSVSDKRQSSVSEKMSNNNNNNNLNMRNSFNSKNKKLEEKLKSRMQNMNGDLNCFKNVKVYNNIDDRVFEKNENYISEKDLDNGYKSENPLSERNINEINSNKYNSNSNTFSDPNDNLIKSKQINQLNEQNYNKGESNYINIAHNEKEEIKKKIYSAKKTTEKSSRENYENMDFQALNVNLNFSNTSNEENQLRDGDEHQENFSEEKDYYTNDNNTKSKNNTAKKREGKKSSSMDLNNDNTKHINKKLNFDKIRDNKENSMNEENINNEITRNSNDTAKKLERGKQKGEIDESYYAQSLHKIRLGEINNPLVIKKYEIKNLEKDSMLRLANGRNTYMPFQKSISFEKIHFNFSNKNNFNNTNFNSTAKDPKVNFSMRNNENLNFLNNSAKKIVVLKK